MTCGTWNQTVRIRAKGAAFLQPAHWICARAFSPPLLTIAGFTIASLVFTEFLVVLAMYYLLTLAYSLKLKKIVIIDVVALATLYTIRIIGGASAIGVTPSFWLLALSLFLFLNLAMLKRFTELQMTLGAGRSVASGRGYHVEDLSLVQPLGTASGLMAVLVLYQPPGQPSAV